MSRHCATPFNMNDRMVEFVYVFAATNHSLANALFNESNHLRSVRCIASMSVSQTGTGVGGVEMEGGVTNAVEDE